MAGKEDPRLVPRGAYVCAVCHQPLRDVVVKRRKVLGTVVPVWGPGPCENPECPRHGLPPRAYLEDEEPQGTPDGHGPDHVGRRPDRRPSQDRSDPEHPHVHRSRSGEPDRGPGAPPPGEGDAGDRRRPPQP